jgi:ATP adenylyltransferase
VSPLHALVIPRRHAETWFDLFEPERRAIRILLDEVRTIVMAQDASATGFNIGMNSGVDAGQTVFHAHTHLIPRRAGDVGNPRGGVRGVIPGKAIY